MKRSWARPPAREEQRYTAVLRVAALILRGEVLVAPTHSVGPVREAVPGSGPMFRCLNRGGSPCLWHEEWKTSLSQHKAVDETAFGAAQAFVWAIGERAALALAAKRANERMDRA